MIEYSWIFQGEGAILFVLTSRASIRTQELNWIVRQRISLQKIQFNLLEKCVGGVWFLQSEMTQDSS